MLTSFIYNVIVMRKHLMQTRIKSNNLKKVSNEYQTSNYKKFTPFIVGIMYNINRDD